MARAPMTLAGADRLREELRQMKTGRSTGGHQRHCGSEERTVISRRTPSITQPVSSRVSLKVALRRSKTRSLVRRSSINSTVNAGDRVVFGAKVTLFNIESEEEAVYQIVGELEANISDDLISSPHQSRVR